MTMINKEYKSLRETFFKIKYEADGLPVGLIFYTFKDFDNIMQVGNNFSVDFKDVDGSINKMIEVKRKYGENFMFFNQSLEGEKFFKDNPIKIVNVLL